MKLKKYTKYINELNEKFPELDVIYSSDDEGNQFDTVNFRPNYQLNIELKDGIVIEESICIN